jgi:hypothetical protein
LAGDEISALKFAAHRQMSRWAKKRARQLCTYAHDALSSGGEAPCMRERADSCVSSGTSGAPPAVPLPVSHDDPGSPECAFASRAGGSSVAAVPARADIAAGRRPLRLAGKVGEAALVRAAQRGSQGAVEELFSRHWRGAYRAALLVTGDRAAAEDIAQEAFLAALRALPRFDVRRPPRPWLHRIVDRAIDWSRARAHRGEIPADAAPDAASVQAGAAFGEDTWPRCWSSRPSTARSSSCAT